MTPNWCLMEIIVRDEDGRHRLYTQSPDYLTPRRIHTLEALLFSMSIVIANGSHPKNRTVRQILPHVVISGGTSRHNWTRKELYNHLRIRYFNAWRRLSACTSTFDLNLHPMAPTTIIAFVLFFTFEEDPNASALSFSSLFTCPTLFAFRADVRTYKKV
jgi:hypothetical protein